jgi:hypothetical protein
MYKTKVSTRAKSGPKPRTTAIRKLVLIEKSTGDLITKTVGTVTPESAF